MRSHLSRRVITIGGNSKIGNGRTALVIAVSIKACGKLEDSRSSLREVELGGNAHFFGNKRLLLEVGFYPSFDCVKKNWKLLQNGVKNSHLH